MSNLELDGMRFAGFYPEGLQDKNVLIVGCGSLGSFTALMLAKNGFNLTLCDFDTVEPHNINLQYFDVFDLWKPKVLALKKRITNESVLKNNVRAVDCKIEDLPRGIIQQHSIFIILVDSLEVRQLAYTRIMESINKFDLLIDCRSGLLTYEIFNVKDNSYDHEAYRQSFNKNGLKDIPCNRSDVCFGVFQVISWIGHSLRNLLNEKILTFYRQLNFGYHPMQLELTNKDYYDMNKPKKEVKRVGKTKKRRKIKRKRPISEDNISL